MANQDAAFGLKPVRHAKGGIIRSSAYTIASGLAQDLYHGDPVISAGSGRNITIATAGGNVRGVFIGCEYTKANGEYVFDKKWPTGTTLLSGTEATAYVWDDPDIIFAVQADGSLVAADMGLTSDLVSGTGDSATGNSGWELDATTGQAQCRILGLSKMRANNAYGTNAVIDIMFAEHELGTGIATGV